MYLLNKRQRDLQDGRGERRGDHLPPHKYIRNTSTCGTTPTEHLLNAGRRPQTSPKARNSPRTWVGQKKKEKTETKNRDSLRDNNKHTNIQIIGVPEEQKKKGTEKIFEEIKLENFPNMGKEIINQVQEEQRVPYRINPRRTRQDTY